MSLFALPTTKNNTNTFRSTDTRRLSPLHHSESIFPPHTPSTTRSILGHRPDLDPMQQKQLALYDRQVKRYNNQVADYNSTSASYSSHKLFLISLLDEMEAHRTKTNLSTVKSRKAISLIQKQVLQAYDEVEHQLKEAADTARSSSPTPEIEDPYRNILEYLARQHFFTKP